MAAFIPAAIAAAGSVAGGYLANKGAGKQSKMEKTKGKLVDQLLRSVQGDGPYSNLFTANEDVFQKSFVEPAKARFRNQIAPQIQQSFIGSGQRGTALDDTLTRAGVDLDQILNQDYYKFQQDAQNRSTNVIGNILSQGNGTTPALSSGQALAQGGAGYLSSDSFQDLFKSGGPFAPSAPASSTQNTQTNSLGGDAWMNAQTRQGFSRPGTYWFGGTR